MRTENFPKTTWTDFVWRGLGYAGAFGGDLTLDEDARERLTEFLSRYEEGLSDDEVDAAAMLQFARDVQDQIHDQYRQF